MKKLNKKQRQQIKAGGWTGALFSGIGSIIKSAFDGVCHLVDSWITASFVNRELDKGHTKFAAKFGVNQFSFDDTASVKAEESVAKAKAPKAVAKQAAAPKPVLIDLSKHHDIEQSHDLDLNHMIENGMHMVDDFMHF